MALKKQKSSIPNPEPGNIPARLVRIIEIGEHTTKFGPKDQVYLHFNLPTRIIDAPDSDYHGKQHMVRTAPLNLSSSPKAGLVKDYIKVLDPSFKVEVGASLSPLLGKAIYLTIDNHETETGEFCNIMNTMGMPEGMPVGEADTTPFCFDFDNPDPDVWHKYIPDYLKEKIQKALNYKGSAVEAMVLKLEAMQGGQTESVRHTEEPVQTTLQQPEVNNTAPTASPVGQQAGDVIVDDIPF